MAETVPPILNAGGDRSQRESVSRTLRSANYAVREVATAAELLGTELAGAWLLVLDSDLPEHGGLDACRRLRDRASVAPVLFIAAGDQVDAAADLADACLQKPLRAAELRAMVKTLTRLAERHAGGTGATAARLDRELSTMQNLACAARPTPVTAESFGLVALHDQAPALFEEAVGRYENLLERAVEQRNYRVNNQVSESLRTLGEELGSLGAGPRDVIEIHNEALHRSRHGRGVERQHVFVEEGRFLVLELMGHLASRYRRYSLGAPFRREAQWPAPPQ